ncbi:exodeoxyribonuclease VII large subunit [Ignatzschineria cameli]|uniref:Exodeoxyribonuclease 7 large subunit n=1 Tax=Ignatzschineria cameli TaxID=2182793 RepID=A0A2U2AKT3_9GAMM|nr:exodeoxyribonuclease VII large subunit [Ignatzschineria cameli]PWD83697.1 exodeoxyribonuclease VII large subunit [Ignatzschineria cameli]PWD88736.1 exodeoxyribonuclease VII large subunit [Ignatzschineria cameli]PWD89690.1 exodeoxyribonuclease VII large subunit [Ignatzschineria cameli]PWD90580.1 exodeoxyribonuclease VII large subunit [Ignatzschineria cameli]
MSRHDLFSTERGGYPLESREKRHLSDAVYSVTALNFAIRDLLEGAFFYCQVEGEVSNAAYPGSGHIYFNLKDEGGMLKSVIWRSQAERYRSLITNGQKIKLTGKVSVYAPRGEYQLIVSRVEEAGVGDLYLQFLALKNRLAEEGLFDTHYKQIIPKHPRKIGIITSRSAAALQDVLQVFSSHRPDIPLKLYATNVQGRGAEHDIANAIERANRENICDLLLLIRGGGSIEDLWCFNEEVVARAIFASKIPIITGVGHETDITIADFVADLRAPTPSMAAKYSSQSRDELYQYLSEVESRLMKMMRDKLRTLEKEIDHLSYRLYLKDPKSRLSQNREQLIRLKAGLGRAIHYQLEQLQARYSVINDRLKRISLNDQIARHQDRLQMMSDRMERALRKKYQEREQAFVNTVEKLTLLSPLNTLLRGYSMTTKEGQLVKSITDVKICDQLEIEVTDGTIDVAVVSIHSS